MIAIDTIVADEFVAAIAVFHARPVRDAAALATPVVGTTAVSEVAFVALLACWRLVDSTICTTSTARESITTLSHHVFAITVWHDHEARSWLQADYVLGKLRICLTLTVHSFLC